MLGKYNIWAIENLANVEALPPNGSMIYNMVDYLKQDSGAPSRVFAVVDETSSSGFCVQGLSARVFTGIGLFVIILSRYF